MLVVNLDVWVLNILVVCDIHNFAFFVGDKSIFFIFEKLPPSWIGCSTSQIARGTVALNIKRMSFPKLVLKSLWNIIKEPLLTLGILSPSSEIYVISSNAFSNSFHW
jgi:hypothetical protein